MMFENARYRIVTTMCRLLRHPSRRVEWAGGGATTSCPCGYINISDRAFRASPNQP